MVILRRRNDAAVSISIFLAPLSSPDKRMEDYAVPNEISVLYMQYLSIHKETQQINDFEYFLSSIRHGLL